MAIRPLRDDRYVVETDGGTYVVDVERGACTCPDSAIRGARCKHLRRVDIEIDAGLVPPPGERTAVCAVCGRETFVPVAFSGPALCPRHSHGPGDLVRDRETGTPLVVVATTGRRADESTTEQGRTVADYESNVDYGGHEPVVEAVYLDSLGSARDLSLSALSRAKRYSFPASRLRRVERGRFDPSPDARGDGVGGDQAGLDAYA